MQLETLRVDPRIARIHYSDYLKRCRENRARRRSEAARTGSHVQLSLIEREDEALKEAYRELSKGRQVININDVMGKAGVDEQNRPKFAIAPATSKRVLMTVESGSGVTFRSADAPWNYSSWPKKFCRVPASRWPEEVFDHTQRYGWSNGRLQAPVPIVPVELRPVNLDRYWILWEAEWEEVPLDPFLLKRISNVLYVIVAQWDLTPLERMVVEERMV